MQRNLGLPSSCYPAYISGMPDHVRPFPHMPSSSPPWASNQSSANLCSLYTGQVLPGVLSPTLSPASLVPPFPSGTSKDVRAGGGAQSHSQVGHGADMLPPPKKKTSRLNHQACLLEGICHPPVPPILGRPTASSSPCKAYGCLDPRDFKGWTSGSNSILWTPSGVNGW